jgi:hypothetical protein
MTDNLIEMIRAAVASDATAEARAAGADACRTIMTALGATAGEPLAVPASSSPSNPMATAIAALVRSTPPDQLLDLVIAKLRTLVPADKQQPAARPMTIPYVKVPRP